MSPITELKRARIFLCSRLKLVPSTITASRDRHHYCDGSASRAANEDFLIFIGHHVVSSLLSLFPSSCNSHNFCDDGRHAEAGNAFVHPWLPTDLGCRGSAQGLGQERAVRTRRILRLPSTAGPTRAPRFRTGIREGARRAVQKSDPVA